MLPNDNMNPRAELDKMYGASYPASDNLGPPGKGDAANPEHWFIDKIENGKASIMQGEKMVSVPVDMLPKGVKEGDTIDPQTGEVVNGDNEGDELRKGMVNDEGGELKL